MQPHALVGFMGGEPMLHPKFADFCRYAITKIPREKLGLWSTFPDSPNYRKHAQLICDTFGNILLNDHSRDDILHAPVLMASEDYFKKECSFCRGKGTLLGAGIMDMELVPKVCPDCNGTGLVTDMRELMFATEHCWVQESWSSAINPKGAFFVSRGGAI